MKKISVIVPCYNAAKYLEKCIQNLLCQTFPRKDMEIILVNDASTDDGRTWELIMEYERKYPDTIIAISLEQNLRQGGARNAGITYARGEYIIFCDADDWLLEETLDHCYCAAKKYDADVVEFTGTNVTDRNASVKLKKGNESCLIEIDTEDKRKLFLRYVNDNFSFGSQTKLYRLSLILDNNITFVEHLIFEEPSFVVPVRLYEKRHFFLDESLYVWYLSEKSTLRSDWEKRHKWDNLQVWVLLMEDLANKILFQTYYEELEYLFFSWGIKATLRMALNKKCSLTQDELKILIAMSLKLFPDICRNKLINSCAEDDDWSRDVLTFIKNMTEKDEK